MKYPSTIDPTSFKSMVTNGEKVSPVEMLGQLSTITHLLHHNLAASGNRVSSEVLKNLVAVAELAQNTAIGYMHNK